LIQLLTVNKDLIWGQPGRVGVRRRPGRRGGGGGCRAEALLLAGRGDNAQDGRAARHAARSGGRALEAGEDGAEEEDGDEADGGRPAAWRGARASADFGRPAVAENPVGQRTGGVAESGGRGG
jgi:hypothetical protein